MSVRYNGKHFHACVCILNAINLSKILYIVPFLFIFRRVHKIAKSDCPSAWDNSAPTGRIFMKFDI
jgi:hypothetical protein